MAHSANIREGMQVIASDGGMVGRVIGLHGNHIHVEPTAPVPGAAEHVVPLSWVSRTDDHVHLDREAALVRETWGSGNDGFTGAGTAAAGTTAHATREAAHNGVGKSWIVWVIGGLLLLGIILLGIRGCGYAADEPNYEDNAKGELSEADRAISGAANADVQGGAAAGALNTQVSTYLASQETAPRTFTFEGLRFDTGSAEIKSEYRQELTQLGQTLAQRPTARVRIVGYADPRGDAGANQNLGKQRAEAVAAALVANGMNARNIETTTGGETASGQNLAEDRKTELVILSR